jgi:AcrR family transcriptional regulator
MKKRPEKTAQTRADLEEAFWLLYATRPLEKITVGEICERAGYNRGTFYLHYRDLHEMLGIIEDRLLAGMTDCVETCMKRLKEDSSKVSCIAACKDVVLYYERNKAYITVLLSERGDPLFIYRLKDNLKPLWREYVIGPVEGRTDEEIDLLLEYTLAGTLFMISRWLSNPGTTSVRQLAHLVYDFSIKEARQRLS